MGNMILLSFDIEEFDGPREHGVDYSLEEGMKVSIEGTNIILDILKANDVRATFFCTGNFAENAPDIIERIMNEGHEVACHGVDHWQPKESDFALSKEIVENVSGITATTHYPNIADNLNPYKITTHRHSSEIKQELHGFDEVKVSFTPHLIPVIRGIQTTSHSFINNENKDITPEELREIYKKEYKGEYFIKLMDEGEIPHLSSVRGSNFVQTVRQVL